MTLSRKWLVALIVIPLIALAGWAVLRGYAGWKAEKALARAREFLKQGRSGEAMISLQTSLLANPKNPAALRVMAEALEQGGSELALSYRRRVVEAAPHDSQGLIDLAICALRFSHPAIASGALEQLPESDRHRADYLDAHAMLLASAGDADGARKCYEEVVLRFPQTRFAKTAELNLAQFWIDDPTSEDPKRAVALLEELASDPNVGLEALRLLVRRSMQHEDAEGAFAYSYRMLGMQGTRIEDDIRVLDLMKTLGCPLYGTMLVWMEASGDGDANRIGSVAKWMLDREGPEEAMKFLNRFPKEKLQVKPLPIVLAECYQRMNDWPALQGLLAGQDWGAFNAQRNAMLSTAYRNQKNDRLAALSWKSAMLAAHDRPGALGSLARLAISEKRTDDAVEALWNIPMSDPEYGAAQKRLFIYYRERNDAPGLLRLVERTLNERPNDPAVKMTVGTLLLVTGNQPQRALKLVREVYQANPKPVRTAAVYAYGVYLENPCAQTAAEAARILDARSAEDKAADDCLPYYGLILTACGRYAEAQDCFRKMSRKLLFAEMAEKIKEAQEKCAANGAGQSGTTNGTHP